MGNITVNELAKKLKVSSKLIGSLLTVLEIPDVTNETMIEYSVEKAVSDVIMREKAKKSARKAEKEAQAEIAKGNDKQEAVLPKALDNEAPVLHVPSDTKSVESVENVKMEPVIASKEPRISPPMQVEGQNAASNQRPPYTPRPQGDAQRPPYTPRPQGDAQRPPYTPRPQGDAQRPPYTPRPQGDAQRPPYTPRPQGDAQRPPYTPRPQGDGQRPPYTPRPQGDGQRPPYAQQGQGARPDNRQQRSGRPTVVPPPPQIAQPVTTGNKMVKKDRKYSDERYRTQDRMFSTDGEAARAGRSNKSSRRPNNRSKMVEKIPNTQIPSHIELGGTVTVKGLADLLKTDAASVIKKLMKFGVMATMNQEIDFDTATLVVEEFGSNVIAPKEAFNPETIIEDITDIEENLVARPPVVTVMGHVDHGKTSLLDAIRSTSVASREAGGITQAIGAYTTEVKGKKITFLDTPGHAAFTAMRARGAQVTDIAVLVVAADDGVMPQTIEAINHAKAAKVPIIVAINKIDRSNAQPERVKQQLTEYALVAEEWGGDTIMVPVSASTHEGIDTLLESIILLSEIMELKANPNRKAVGTVIESKLDKGRGPVATVLVNKGTLNIGDVIIVGKTFGKVRAMIDDKGRRIKKAGPSMPVEVVGLSDVPDSSDSFYVVEDERQARQLAEVRASNQKIEEQKQSTRITLEDLFTQMSTGEVKDLNLILKADVFGSIDAIKNALEKLSTPEIKVNLVHTGVGAISETDVMLASASHAIIIGFNMRPDPNAQKIADQQSIDIRTYRIIYEILDDVKAAMKGLLSPVIKDTIIGHVEVREIFRISKVGNIAGCYVNDGKVTRSSLVRVIRDGAVIFEGEIDSLRRLKDDVKEVAAGYECGIMLERFNDIKTGDRFEVYIKEEVKRTDL
ncbi:MAG TPA: translation initiation factor IF-2 [Bacillota bacterium]|nr:translation initiation factor IF-2 [Bacillota bacterium]